MGTTKFTDLADYLRSKGLKVQEIAGWKTRSSNWDKSFSPKGIVCHHTAGPTAGGNYPSYDTVLNGRKGLAGPLAQFGLGRDGTVILIGGHRANHAGAGGPMLGIPQDSANAYMWGIEAENSGYQTWPAVQMQAYYKLCAALATYPKAPFSASMIIGHKEWAPGRKPDPSFSMSAFRTQVQAAINAMTNVKPVPVTDTNPHTTSKVDNLGNPRKGAGPYDGRWTRGPIPQLPLYLYDVYLMVAKEDGRYGRSLDAFQLAHQAKIVSELDHLARLKRVRPQRTLVNLIKQVQTLWFGYDSHHPNYGLFDRKLLDLFIKRQGWTFWDGPRG